MANIFFSIIGIVAIIYIFMKVKKNLFSEKESFFWIFGGLLILILSIFPKLIDNVAYFVGISYPPSLLFLFSMIFVIFLLFRQSQNISIMNERIKELVQRNALLEEKFRQLSQKLKDQM